ncbi:hypothetical protein GCM10007933_20650 [Zoogloea oryzae]|uniref:Uncharacterized protein n=1 Tax=Zoogloea oryzae TaxID=310767 RepID=A0ABQ6FD07_9RHOO|nr:hypothetical protein GCM10007933_20650 [Zoogloea oryzae]
MAGDLFGRDAELGGQIAQFAATEDLADLIGAHRKVLASADPRRGLLTQASLAEPRQQTAKATLAVVLEQIHHQLQQGSLTTATLLAAASQRPQNLTCQLIEQTHREAPSLSVVSGNPAGPPQRECVAAA